MPDTASAPAEPDKQPERPAGGVILRGTPVAPGLALGLVHRKDYDLLQASLERVPLEAVERELNRFHQALVDARAQLANLKARLAGKVPVDDARILDVHVAYLKDSVFISDVENLILNEQLSLEAAIAKVISDFDRIFRLVQNETLRERAVDLRDVGIRVLRHLEKNRAAERAENPAEPAAAPTTPPAPARPADYVLAARELSIVDMFNLSGERVLGILTEAGALTSHAAILARSMRIPTLTAVQGLLDTVREGDFVILDASEGTVRVNPDEVVRAQYTQARDKPAPAEEPGDWPGAEARTIDDESIRVAALCGNLPEVEQAIARRVAAIGLYRTELLFLVDKALPSVDTLHQHYASVVAAARGVPVTLRLLHVDSSLGVNYLHAGREPNPALGRAGVRALLSREQVLRRQLQAILRAGVDADVRVLVPFVTDTGEMRRIKEILFEERLELRKSATPHQQRIALGVAIETPAAVLGVRDLAREADFLVVGLDSLVQYLLAADRDNDDMRASFETLHPYVVRALRSVVEVCDEMQKPLSIFGVLAVQAHNLPFLVGVGLREFCVPPEGLREFVGDVGRISVRGARRAAQTAAASSCQAETMSLVDGYRHGYVRS
jgi:phosphoenolpyruvate-protein phosphotransferase